jgi:putative phosphoesterase
MTRIGVISDTHGKLDPRVLDLFENVERIFHAGDIGSGEILIDLGALAPLTAVLGNVDAGAEARGLSLREKVEVDGVWIHLSHGHLHSQAEKRISSVLLGHAENLPAAAIVGHSHRPYLAEHGGVLFMNPGSASRPKFGHPASVGFLEIDEGKVEGRLVDLDGNPLESDVQI